MRVRCFFFVVKIGIHYRWMLCGRSYVLSAGFQVLKAIVKTYPEIILNALCDEIQHMLGLGGPVALIAIWRGLGEW